MDFKLCQTLCLSFNYINNPDHFILHILSKLITKMKRHYIILLVLSLSSAISVNAQNLKSILKKHYEAVGQNVINKADAIIINGKISQMGLELPFVMYQKRPGKVKFSATFQDMSLVQVFDGKNGWAINPMAGPDPIEMGVGEKKTMQSLAEMEGRLYNWKKKKYKASYEGIEDFEGKKVYKIKILTPDDILETYFINTVTYLINQIDTEEKVEGIDVESTKKLSDYRDIQGYKVPFKTETKMMGEYAGDLEIVSFEFKSAKEVSDDLFEKPEAEN